MFKAVFGNGFRPLGVLLLFSVGQTLNSKTLTVFHVISMTTVTVEDEDYKALVELAGKMQTALGKRVSLGTAAGSACRYVLSETKRVEELLIKSKGKE